MGKIKKIVALLLALILACSMVSCGEPEDVRGDQTSNNGETDKEFSMGETDGLTYENDFIGLGCTLDSDWTFYTDEQIRELNNLTADILDEDVAEAIANAEIVYDMYAMYSNQMDSINVNLEKMNVITLAKLDIARNFETVFTTVKDQYEKAGYTNIEYEIVTVEIDGKEFTAMNITANIQTVTMYQTLISVKCTGYLANIAITVIGENRIDAILDRFYVVKGD